MIFKKKKRIKELEKENEMLKRTIETQVGIINNQQLQISLNGIKGGNRNAL